MLQKKNTFSLRVHNLNTHTCLHFYFASSLYLQVPSRNQDNVCLVDYKFASTSIREMSRPPYANMPWPGVPNPSPALIGRSMLQSPTTEGPHPPPHFHQSSTSGQMQPPPTGAMVSQQLISRQWQAHNPFPLCPPFIPWHGPLGAFSPCTAMMMPSPATPNLALGVGAFIGAMHAPGPIQQHPNFQAAAGFAQPNASQQVLAMPDHSIPTTSGHPRSDCLNRISM